MGGGGGSIPDFEPTHVCTENPKHIVQIGDIFKGFSKDSEPCADKKCKGTLVPMTDEQKELWRAEKRRSENAERRRYNKGVPFECLCGHSVTVTPAHGDLEAKCGCGKMMIKSEKKMPQKKK